MKFTQSGFPPRRRRAGTVLPHKSLEDTEWSVERESAWRDRGDRGLARGKALEMPLNPFAAVFVPVPAPVLELLELPKECLETVYENLDSPRDVLSLATSCRACYEVAASSRLRLRVDDPLRRTSCASFSLSNFSCPPQNTSPVPVPMSLHADLLRSHALPLAAVPFPMVLGRSSIFAGAQSHKAVAQRECLLAGAPPNVSAPHSPRLLDIAGLTSIHISGALVPEAEVVAALRLFPRLSTLRLEGCQKVIGDSAAEAIMTSAPSLACVCIVRTVPHQQRPTRNQPPL